jgi:hypothetical protein
LIRKENFHKSFLNYIENEEPDHWNGTSFGQKTRALVADFHPGHRTPPFSAARK